MTDTISGKIINCLVYIPICMQRYEVFSLYHETLVS
jgi:hypothetical protein